MRDFRKLKVWQKARHLTLRVYELSSGFPPDERFGLTSQIRRAAVSVAANIAEACGRNEGPQKGHLLNIAAGSASEIECLLIVACDLGFLAPDEGAAAADLTMEIRRMLAALARRVGSAPSSDRTAPRAGALKAEG